MLKTIWSAAWLAALLLTTMAAQAALPARLADGEKLPSLAPMLDRTTPAVVNIATYTTVQVRNPLLEDPFFRRFFDIPQQRRYRRTQSAGSGVVVDAARGFIVTNHHVVARADEITITLSDGRSLPARLIGSDPQVDLAVLQVEAEDLHEIEFADSGELRVGDFVVAIGNPFGLNQTVTSGIVSALGRSGLGIEGYEDFIQTDASINPGNSGGALVDLAGRLVGINTAILAPSGGNVGIGFAIPSNMVRAVMDQLIEHGEVRRGYLGIAVQGLNVELAEAFGLDRRDGVVVVEVEPDSPADEAGVEIGDVVIRVDDRPIRRVSDYHSQTAVIFVGSEVELEVLRDGRVRRLTLEVSEDQLERAPGERIDPRLSGTQLQNLRNQGDDGLSAGVLVTEVSADSRAWQYGLRPGDVIVGLDRQPIRDIAEFREAARQSGQQLLLRVYRAGQYGYVAIR
ncbi:MAG TPA: DegQ family serine endoprotease [Pseudomonadales bacterium]